MNVHAIAFAVLVVALIAGVCVADYLAEQQLRREERRARIMQACLRERQLGREVYETSPARFEGES